nr:MAG TPA_asm: hypothetical protein [Bacteriophage sp.]
MQNRYGLPDDLGANTHKECKSPRNLLLRSTHIPMCYHPGMEYRLHVPGSLRCQMRGLHQVRQT